MCSIYTGTSYTLHMEIVHDMVAQLFSYLHKCRRHPICHRASEITVERSAYPLVDLSENDKWPWLLGIASKWL